MAQDGGKGMGKNCYGKNAKDVIIEVPVGTVVYVEPEHTFLCDLNEEGKEFVVAKGGRGGRGNACFKSPTNRTPRVAENGLPGEKKILTLELKLLADVGFVGFPSVGKSTLLSIISNANPEIADYPFTTIAPNLGVVSLKDGRSFVAADLPGLIEGAHQGKGLGLQFLRHIERCRVLVHVIDISSEDGRDPIKDFEIINEELKSYNLRLMERPMVIVANKMDDPGSELLLEYFKEQIGDKYKIFPVSALERKGLEPLLFELANLVDSTPEFPLFNEVEGDEKVFTYESNKDDEKGYIITRPSAHLWVIKGDRIEKIYKMTNISTEEGLMYLTTIMRKMGIEDELRSLGIQEGDIVKLVDFEFEYYD